MGNQGSGIRLSLNKKILLLWQLGFDSSEVNVGVPACFWWGRCSPLRGVSSWPGWRWEALCEERLGEHKGWNPLMASGHFPSGTACPAGPVEGSFVACAVLVLIRYCSSTSSMKGRCSNRNLSYLIQTLEVSLGLYSVSYAFPCAFLKWVDANP